MPAPLPQDETRRLEALERYRILDTTAEQAFDDIARIASLACAAPVALVTLVDRARQWFKARVGLEASETPREYAFCAHTILGQDVMVVPDALADRRFATNPLVLEPPQIRFYAGAPVITPEGHALGSVCVIDRRPRTLSAEEHELLRRLAREAMAQLELRRTLLDVDREIQEAGAAERVARVNEVLEQGEERIRVLLERSADVVALIDPEAVIRYTSPVTRKILGYGSDELVGRSALDLIHPEDRPFAAGKLREAVARPGVVGGIFARALHKDGRWRLLEGSLTNLLDDPHVRAIVLNYRDVTERRRVQEEIRQAQKMEAVGRLAAGVAHDFNNLMTAVLGYNEILRPQARAPEAREAVDEIRRAGERAAELTQQLLAFGRRQPLQPAVLDLNALVEGLGGLLRRLIGEQIDVRIRLAPSLPRLRADRSQVEQVVLNLAVNARDAMPRGGTLWIETHPAEGGAAPDLPPGRYAELRIVDTGEGMRPEVVARIFEPFFTTKPPGRGVGLGLSTVDGIVRQSGGHVSVNSRPGAGSAFRVFFPAVDAPPDRLPAPVSPSRPRLAAGRILVVEDEDSVRRLVVQTLRQAGFDVVEASDGTAAVAAAGGDPDLDAVVSDVVMPGLSGPDAVARIRAGRPGLPVLFMTGYSDEVVAGSGSRHDDPVLRKPFLPDKLLEAVRSLLDRR